MLKINFRWAMLVLLSAVFSLSYNGSILAETGEDVKMVDVKVLSIKGCQATPPTIELVESVAKEMKITINLTVSIIETAEQAKKERFIGSPTVQINGLDIEPASREIDMFGVT